MLLQISYKLENYSKFSGDTKTKTWSLFW